MSKDLKECFICKNIHDHTTAMKGGYTYSPQEMTSHPQSGDMVCRHCADSVVFEYCKFCANADDSLLCKLTGDQKKPHDTCDDYCIIEEHFSRDGFQYIGLSPGFFWDFLFSAYFLNKRYN